MSCTKFSVPKYGGWETVLLFYIHIKLIEWRMIKMKKSYEQIRMEMEAEFKQLHKSIDKVIDSTNKQVESFENLRKLLGYTDGDK
ncbi:MAG: hypothetical protein ABF649_12355 [Bacillus sp. (in: firmicutes)]